MKILFCDCRKSYVLLLEIFNFQKILINLSLRAKLTSQRLDLPLIDSVTD